MFVFVSSVIEFVLYLFSQHVFLYVFRSVVISVGLSLLMYLCISSFLYVLCMSSVLYVCLS